MPRSGISEIILEMDEFEAIRLADLEGLYQEEAAKRMNVSRQTFGRIISSARKKIATALIDGYALKVEGGSVEIERLRRFRCGSCDYEWQTVYGVGYPDSCPECASDSFVETDNYNNVRGQGGRGNGRNGRGGGRGRNRKQGNH